MCLGIRDSHRAEKKDQLLSSAGQQIPGDESCLHRKKDRSRGLALSCLLERKEGKCITETESCDSDGREHQNIQTKESQIVEVVV